MVFCPNCGTQNPDGANCCMKCGTQFVAAPVYAAPAQTPAPATVPGKGLGIASLVCGIVSFFCFGVILGILAVVFGGVAKSKGYKGGMATAGIVLGIIGLALYVLTLILWGGAVTAMFGL